MLRNDPDSLEGGPLKCKPGSPWDWNVFLRVMKTGEEAAKDVVDWATLLVTDEVFNAPTIVDAFQYPIEFFRAHSTLARAIVNSLDINTCNCKCNQNTIELFSDSHEAR